MTDTENKQLAETILAQLGGRRFIAMTGAKLFGRDGASLFFSLPGTRNFVKDGINKVVVTLDPSDTYTVKFYRIRGVKVTVVAEVSDIYAEDLRRVFTIHTGLETSL